MRQINITNLNHGGLADSEFQGLNNTMASMIGIDVHSKPGLNKIRRSLEKVVSANAPNEFCKQSLKSSNGCTYFFSNESGKIWEENSGTYRLAYTITAMNGESKVLGAEEYDGYIYFATQNFLHRIKTSKASSTWSTYVEANWADLTLDQELTQKAPVVAKFDGVDDYISIASSVLNHTDVTFSCWFYADQDTSEVNRMTIFGANNTASNLQVELGGDSTSLPNRNRVAIMSGSTIVAQTDNNVFETSGWYHLVYTRSSNTHHIYINGVDRTLITSGTTAFANTTNARYIGVLNTSLNNPFKGMLAEIKIQTTVLSSADVLSSYNGTLKVMTNILQYYPLCNTSKDFGSVGATATLSGNLYYTYVTKFYFPFSTLLLTSLSEKDADKKFFQSNSETLTYIKVWVTDKGTGDISVALHDSTNTIQGSIATIVNANIVNGWNYFYVNASGLTYNGTYHIHIYSSVADGYIKSTNYEDIADGFYQLLSTADNNYHQMKIQNLVLFIGDRNYIHQVDIDRTSGSHLFSSRALDIVSTLSITTLGIMGNDLLIGTKTNNGVVKAEIIRWDTWSQSFNSHDTIEEQGINAFLDADNYVIVSAGTKGNLYYYDGNLLKIMRDIPGEYESGEIIIYPDAVATFDTIPLFGVSNSSNNPALQGVYSFGSKNPNYPSIICLDYPISQRSSGSFVTSNIEIGSITLSGNSFFVCWRDNNAGVSGVDKLSLNKLSGAYIETLHTDIDIIIATNFRKFICKYYKLPNGCDIVFKYRTQYTDSWIEVPSYRDAIHLMEVAETSIQSNTIQLRVEFVTSGVDAPSFTDLVIIID